MAWFGKKKAKVEEKPAMTETISSDNKVATRPEVEELLNRLLTDKFNKFRNELLAECGDKMTEQINIHKESIGRICWAYNQMAFKMTETGPFLWPDRTRMYYRKGNVELLLQEFSPQVRQMRFEAALSQRPKESDAVPKEALNKVFSYSLALPYMVFVYRFVDGVMGNAYLAFSDRPLKSLDEKMLVPPLSNLNNDLRICHGGSFRPDQLIKDDLTQQIAYMQDTFWQTVYTNEWAYNFWNAKTHFANDSRMLTLDAWQEASMENPLFVLEDVQWKEYNGGTTFGDFVIEQLDSVSPQDSELQRKIFDEYNEAFLSRVSERLLETFKSFNPKIDVTADLNKLFGEEPQEEKQDES